MKCIICRGCPGQGKSQFIRTVFPDIFHVENDMYHIRNGKYCFDYRNQNAAVSWCMDMCDRALACGFDIAISNTFTKARYIEAYKKIAELYKAEFIVYRMRGEFDNTHSVPENVLENMRENFQDWPGEINVYPNLKPRKDNQNSQPYLFTNLNVGDKIQIKKFDGSYDSAKVTKICQRLYDCLNVYFIKDDNSGGICEPDDCLKIGD